MSLLGETAARRIARRHPGVAGRLPRDPSFLIDPVDLPWRFLIRPGRTPPALRVARRGACPEADATIRAPSAALIDLLEGRLDGDALFFSRDLVIEGDTEAVVALRNAVDGAEIRVIDDLLAALGPFAGAAKRVCRGASALIEGAAARTERILESLDARKRPGA